MGAANRSENIIYFNKQHRHAPDEKDIGDSNNSCQQNNDKDCPKLKKSWENPAFLVIIIAAVITAVPTTINSVSNYLSSIKSATITAEATKYSADKAASSARYSADKDYKAKIESARISSKGKIAQKPPKQNNVRSITKKIPQNTERKLTSKPHNDINHGSIYLKYTQ